jgi:hypothetical protein
MYSWMSASVSGTDEGGALAAEAAEAAEATPTVKYSRSSLDPTIISHELVLVILEKRKLNNCGQFVSNRTCVPRTAFAVAPRPHHAIRRYHIGYSAKFRRFCLLAATKEGLFILREK